MKKLLIIACTLLPFATLQAQEVSKVILPTNNGQPDGKGNKPLGTPGGPHVPELSQSLAPLVQAGIKYHGGPVMTAPIKTYYIWYGNWAGNSATTILPNFMNGLNNSPYWKINQTYTNAANVQVSSSISLAGSTTVAYPYGTSLSDATIQKIVSDAITSGKLPKDLNGIYFVLTSKDVTASSGFCTQYCGWHTHGTISGSDIKYSFVGNSDRCPTSCAAQSVSPNGNAGADGMASIIAHEAEESATDPDLNAWYDSSGQENGDKCAWKFGTTFTAGNGYKYNLTLAGKQYLIQQNWKNAGTGSCALQ